MSPEQLAQLGQAFSQADPSHARRFGGSGLGMSICYRLATLMGGSITCHSQPNAGTTFTLRLPAGQIVGLPRVSCLEEIYPEAAHDPSMERDVETEDRLSARVLVAGGAPAPGAA